MNQGLEGIEELDEIPDYVEDTGEVNWLVQEAVEKVIPISVITQSAIELFKTREKKSNTARAVAIMRHGFGGHLYGENEYTSKERKKQQNTPGLRKTFFVLGRSKKFSPLSFKLKIFS